MLHDYYYLRQYESAVAAPAAGNPAFDAYTQGSNEQWVATMTVNHTPSGTPRGVVVLIAGGAYSVDEVTGVTYGGQAMSRAAFDADVATELGVAWVYFLGTGVPTGAQDAVVSLDQGGNQSEKVVSVVTLTGDADLTVADSDSIADDQADPSLTLSAGSDTGIALACAYTGHDVPATGLTVLSGVTSMGTHDWGAYGGAWVRQTTPATGDFTIGWTALSDDVAMVGIMVV